MRERVKGDSKKKKKKDDSKASPELLNCDTEHQG